MFEKYENMQTDHKKETESLLFLYKRKLTFKKIVNITSKRDNDGDTQLMLLIIQKYTDLADFIIRQCLDPVLFDVQNNYRQSVLHIAVYLKQKELVTTLITKGARMDLVDCIGRNIFHLYVRSTDLDIFHAIGEAAAEIGKSNSLVNLLDSVDYYGCTQFYLAVKCENKPFCKYLSRLGADVNAANPKNGNTASHHVILSNTYSNQLDFVKFLTEECHADVKIPNYLEMTAEITAQINGKQKITDHLESLVRNNDYR